MTRWIYDGVLPLLILLLGLAVQHTVDAMEPFRNRKTARLVLSRRKVRGSNKNSHSRRLISDSSEQINGKDDLSAEVSTGRKASETKSEGKDGKGTKSMKSMHPSKSKSQTSMKSMDSKAKSGKNIFDHQNANEEDVEREVIQVQCGSEENPFLSTFIVSIQLQEVTGSQDQGRRLKSAPKSTKIEVDDGAEDDADENPVELPVNALSPAEERTLQETFRHVYNNWTFYNCDGFFRTVYTVAMTLAEKDENDEEYAVTLENTYKMEIQNGTVDENVVPGLTVKKAVDNPNHFGGRKSNSSSAPQKFKEPTAHAQTVTGGEDRPIYFVSLAATCRNCAVTREVNFPLLSHAEDDYIAVIQFESRQGGQNTTNTTNTTTPEKIDESQLDNGNCTCSVPVEGEDVATSRRKRTRHRQRRLEGHTLYVPPPDAPTAEEFIVAMNNAIEKLQQNEGKLLRVAGLVGLIEPDYFEGEPPEFQIPETANPTTSPMPTVSASPTQPPTISSMPTLPSTAGLKPSSSNDTVAEAPPDATTQSPTSTPARDLPEQAVDSSGSASRTRSLWYGTAVLLSFAGHIALDTVFG
jgi:hypothetical protein